LTPKKKRSEKTVLKDEAYSRLKREFGRRENDAEGKEIKWERKKKTHI